MFEAGVTEEFVEWTRFVRGESEGAGLNGEARGDGRRVEQANEMFLIPAGASEEIPGVREAAFAEDLVEIFNEEGKFGDGEMLVHHAPIEFPNDAVGGGFFREGGEMSRDEG